MATRLTLAAVIGLAAILLAAPLCHACASVALDPSQLCAGGACVRTVFFAAMLYERNAFNYTIAVTSLADNSSASTTQSGASGFFRRSFYLLGGGRFRVQLLLNGAPEIAYYNFMYAPGDSACGLGVELVFPNGDGRFHTWFGYGRHQRPREKPCAECPSTAHFAASSAVYFDRCLSAGRSERVVQLPPGAAVTDGNGADIVMHFTGAPPPGMCAFAAPDGSPPSYCAVVERYTSWKVFDGGAPPSGYNSPVSDGQWVSRRASIGWGMNTTSHVAPNLTAYYFRKTITLEEIGCFQNRSAMLLSLVKDGFVAYLNGEEIARGNMPPGAPTYDTRASGSSYVVNRPKQILTAPLNMLRSPHNWFVLEVHARSTQSPVYLDSYLLLGSGCRV